MTKLSYLFQPLRIGPVELRNRIVEAPMSTHLADSQGRVTERLLDYFEERARGGAGLIIVEFSYIDDSASQCAYNQLGVYDDSLRRGLSELAERIKAHGARAGLQLCHAGSQRPIGRYPIVAPSPIPWQETGLVPKQLTEEEIEEIGETFGQAALRAKQCGFDMVEIHGAHGYLITQFLSPNTNQRQDRYGGSLENRMRFPLAVASKVIDEVGGDFPVGMRLSADEYAPRGITLAETQQLAKELEGLGISLLHISAGVRLHSEKRILPMFMPRGYNIPLAQGIKQVVKIPVIASGAINDPELAEEVIREGKADLVSMARPLLADPHLPVKSRAGRLTEVRKCIRCNDCLNRIREHKVLKCSINFSAGREARYRLEPVARPKRVLIAGGGPAGLEAARVAAGLGHQVSLYEREKELGGHLRLAAVMPELKELLDYYLFQMEKLKIEPLLGRELTADMVERERADCTLVAVGGRSIRPEVPGIESPRVVTVVELFEGAREVGDNVVVAGGDLIGCEAAWVLADVVKSLTIIDERPEIPFAVERGIAAVFKNEFEKRQVKLLPGVKLKQVRDGRVTIGCPDGREQLVAADTLVLALGFEPDTGLTAELEDRGLNCRPLGDCRAPAKLMGAIHDGALAAFEI